MGMGFCTSEEVKFHPETGRLLNNSALVSLRLISQLFNRDQVNKNQPWPFIVLVCVDVFL